MKEVNFEPGKNLLLRWAGVKKILQYFLKFVADFI
jgi:hypothetical protein